jgi:hypothetical protein
MHNLNIMCIYCSHEIKLFLLTSPNKENLPLEREDNINRGYNPMSYFKYVYIYIYIYIYYHMYAYLFF